MVRVAGSCMAAKAEPGWVGPLEWAGAGLIWAGWPCVRIGDRPTFGRTN